MKTAKSYSKVLWIIAIALIITGSIDPLEGSVLIAAGSILLAVLSRLNADRQQIIFLVASVFIVAGVIYMFWISSQGGIGGSSGRSWWWGAPVLPYPIGWLMLVVTLIYKAFGKRNTSGKIPEL